MIHRASSWVRRLFRGARPTSPIRTRRLNLEVLEDRTVPAAGWTALAHNAPASIGTMELLTDGTVLAQGAGVNAAWYKLTPDATGSYVNGTWSTMASMHDGRLYTATNVLLDGRVFVLGGEYTTSGGNNWSNTGEVYDPVSNTWTSTPNFLQSQFGDDPGMLMDDGRVLLGYLAGAQTYYYNPGTNSFSVGPTKLYGEQSDEETWVKLPDGSVLTYNIFTNPQTAQKLDPTTNTWVAAGNVPVQLETSSGKELGGAVMLMDGRVLFLGATNHTAIYTPSTNSWVAGPDIPGGLGCNDAPCAILPDGHVIFDAGVTPNFANGSSVFDYDPIANTITQITTPAALTNQLAGAPAYTSRFLMLPNGQALFTSGNGTTLFAYTAAGTAQAAWKPTITSISVSGNVYTLTGTQITGMSAGASYGDDANMETNYPIVELTDGSGNVYFAKTTNWSTTRVQTGSAPETVQFTLPAGLPGGPFNLTVSASGITSDPVTFSTTRVAKALSFSVQPTNVTAGQKLNTVKVQILDQFGAVMSSDNTDQITMTVGVGPDTFAVGSTLTAITTNGVATFNNLTLNTAGNYQLLAKLNSTVITPDSLSFMVQHAALSLSASTVSLSKSSFGLGSPVTATLRATDAFGNLVGGGLNVAFGLGSNAGAQGTFSAVTDNGDGTYTASFTANSAGTNTVTASIGGQAVTSSPPSYTVTAGTFTTADFKGYGVFRYNDATGWQQLTTTDPTLMATDARGDVIAEFSNGVWLYEGTSWKQLSGAIASSLDIASTLSTMYAVGSFGNGVWRYTDAGGWQQLGVATAAQVAVDSAGDVVGSYTGSGVWLYTSGTWTQLLSLAANSVDIAGNGTVAANFAGYGVFRYTTATGWVQLGSTSAMQVAVDDAGEVVGTFASGGVWRYSGTAWTQLSTSTADFVDIAADGTIVGSFKGYGIGRYKTATGWQQQSSTTANLLAIG
jgi:hypothetical protein